MQAYIRNQIPGLLGLVLGLLTSCAMQREIRSFPSHAGSIPTPNVTPQTSATQTRIQQETRLSIRYGQLPLHFEPNQGQTDSQVKFLSRGRGYSLYLIPTEAVLALRQNWGNGEEENQKAKGKGQTGIGGWGLGASDSPSQGLSFSPQHSALSTQHFVPSAPTTQPPAVVRLQLLGANLNPQVVGVGELPGKVNYFLGNDSTKWRTNIPTYTKVKYHDVYPGVDLVYYGNQRQLEYDFVVAPGVDPSIIQLSLRDQSGQNLPLTTDANGNLLVQLASGGVRLGKPLVYQEIDGVRREIAGDYIVRNTQHATPNPRLPIP